jgi:predicted metal-binding membrane protein
MQAKLRPITTKEVRDQLKAKTWPWAAGQLFTWDAMSLVMKFRQDIAQRRKTQNDKAYIRWMIGWATIAGAKKMASSYEEQLQDCVSPLAASHPTLGQPVNDVRYNKQIQVCMSPCVASRPRSGNQP